jgi:hypothetical protein
MITTRPGSPAGHTTVAAAALITEILISAEICPKNLGGKFRQNQSFRDQCEWAVRVELIPVKFRHVRYPRGAACL